MYVAMHHRGLKKITRFIFLISFTGCKSLPVADEIKNKKDSTTEHLKSLIIKDICAKKDIICNTYTLKLCAVRLEKGKFLYREFPNDCYLFLVNMCKYPGREWAIIHRIPCSDSNQRRVGDEKPESNEPDLADPPSPDPDPDEGGSAATSGPEPSEGREVPYSGDDDADDEGTETKGNSTESEEAIGSTLNDNGTEGVENSTEALRAGRWVFTTVVYEVLRAQDGHKCPQSCPAMHDPVCVNLNRGFGKYFRLLHFSNHCEADRHFCANANTLYKQPEGSRGRPNAIISKGAYSNCASGSYMDFRMFAQTASSMAHYGWLAGPQRAQFIVDSPLRLPGTG